MNKFPTCLNFLFLSLSRMYPMFKKNQMRKNNRRLSRYNTRDIIAQSSPKLDQAHRSWCKYEMEAHVSKEIIDFDFFLKIIDIHKVLPVRVQIYVDRDRDLISDHAK